MPLTMDLIFIALAYLLIKHCVVDFFLQTPYQYLNKGRYLHPGGLLHSALHGIGSLPVLWLLPASFGVFVVVILGEVLIHYHTDFAKDRLSRANGWTPDQPAYWNAFGIDQLIHGLTYLAMVYVLVAPRT